jgi:hypothetical protein
MFSHGNEHSAVTGPDIQNAHTAQYGHLTNRTHDFAAALDFPPEIFQPDLGVLPGNTFGGWRTRSEKVREVAVIRLALREALPG